MSGGINRCVRGILSRQGPILVLALGDLADALGAQGDIPECHVVGMELHLSVPTPLPLFSPGAVLVPVVHAKLKRPATYLPNPGQLRV